MQYRPLTPKNKYYLPKETFLTVVHYCRQYPQWAAELDALLDGNRAIRYDTDKIQASGDQDPVFNAVAKREKISRKKGIVDRVARRVAGEALAKYLILGVCYGLYFHQLQQHGIPCGKDMYYQMRRRFYYELSEELP